MAKQRTTTSKTTASTTPPKTTTTKGKKASSAEAAPKAVQAMAAAPMTTRPAGLEEIRRHAYWLWERAGRPAGDGAQFWIQAERELRGS